jgi:hypothetical protein
VPEGVPSWLAGAAILRDTPDMPMLIATKIRRHWRICFFRDFFIWIFFVELDNGENFIICRDFIFHPFEVGSIRQLDHHKVVLVLPGFKRGIQARCTNKNPLDLSRPKGILWKVVVLRQSGDHAVIDRLDP